MGAGGDWKINLLFDFYWIYRDVFVEIEWDMKLLW